MPTPTRPSNIQIPFAASGAKNVIPVGSSSPLASFTDGFPPVNMQPVTVGGVPPQGKDFNGILFDITSHTLWVNAGGQYLFDSALSAAMGGYPVGMVLQNNALTGSYVNVLAGNTTDFNSTPSSIGISWLPWAGAAVFTSGATWCGTSTGSTNAQVLTPDVHLAAYVAGRRFAFVAGYTNSNALTVNISGLGVRNVYKESPTGPIPMTGGEVVAGNIATLIDDGTQFQLADTSLGTAALANASSSTGIVAAVSGATVGNHVALFADTTGTIKEGPALTSNSATMVVSTSGSFTVGHVLAAGDTSGTAVDGGTVSTLSGSSTVGHLPKYNNTTGQLVDGPAMSGGSSATVVASTTGAFTVGHALTAADTNGTVQDSGAAPLTSANTRVLLNTLTASTSAFLQDSTSLTATYPRYEINFIDLIPDTTGSSLCMQVLEGGVAQTGAHYSVMLLEAKSNNTVGAVATSGDTRMLLTANTVDTGGSSPQLNGSIVVANPSVAGKYKGFNGTLNYPGGGFGQLIDTISGYWANDTNAINGIKVYYEGHNILSGKVEIWGIP